MKKQNFFKLLSLFLVTSAAFAQVQKAQTLQVGNTSTNTQSASAALQIDSTTRGFLPPRMTAIQRAAISLPAAGLMVYQSDGTSGLYYYTGSAWVYINNLTGSTLPVANGGTGVTTSTGTGSVVLSNSPTLVTPVLGTPSSVTLTNATGLPLTTGVTGTLPVANGGTGTTTGSITGTSALTFTAGGTNTDVTISPNGTGNTVLNGDAVVGASSPKASAVLEAASTTKGFLPPRMTQAQRSAIVSPAAGLIVWCTNCGAAGELQVSNGTTWTNMVGATASGTVPGAPTSPVAAAGNAQASVAFNAPASNGGSAITGYTVTSSPGNFTSTGISSPLVVPGLTNGTSYTFTVVATNAAGNSVASVASVAVIPLSCSANVGGTTKTFMCYNLGVTVTQAPFSYESGNNNGVLYQWGRQTDGHEVRTSTPQAGPVATPVANRFITNSTSPSDWINPQNNSLWLDASKTANDPCPPGFRVPTQAQWGGLFRDGTTSGAPNEATRNTWTWTGNGYTVGANLYLPAAGYRNLTDATLAGEGTVGFYWSSTVFGPTAYNLYFLSGSVTPGANYGRARGFSVRCVSE